jgi:hypothetical protein
LAVWVGAMRKHCCQSIMHFVVLLDIGDLVFY